MSNDHNENKKLSVLDYNQSWCPIPWVTYSINSLGHYRLCVQANSYKSRNDRWRRDPSMGKFTRGTLWETHDPTVEDNKPLNCLTTDLDAMRNNDLLKEVREYMLRGERHPICLRCNEEDDNGIVSRRMSHRGLHEKDGFTIVDAFEHTEKDGTIPDTSKVPLLGADIRLGNLCNQKCRMCYPGESTSWYQEWFDTFQYRHVIYEGFKSKKLPKFTGPGNTKLTIGLDSNDKADIIEHQVLDNEDTVNANVIVTNTTDPYAWTDSKVLFEKLSEKSPNVNHIHMSGGEPLMIIQHYEFLQGYVDNGQAKDIVLNYNTNLSNIPQRALDLWQHFKLIEIRASVDAPGKINEYIRFPSNWEIVLRNLRLLTKVKKEKKINLSLEIITTVQLYNVFYLRELVDEFTQKHDDIEINHMVLHMLHNPPYFNITTLPSSVKEIVTRKLEKIGQETGVWEEEIQGVINHMCRKDTTDALDQFFIETRLMDKYRNQSFEDVMPELYRLIKRDDPLRTASTKIYDAMEKLDDAYIVNVTETDVDKSNQLRYTQIQILTSTDSTKKKTKALPKQTYSLDDMDDKLRDGLKKIFNETEEDVLNVFTKILGGKDES